MTLTLDANVLIDLANGRVPAVRRRFDEALEAGETLVTCSLAAHELVFGAVISRRPKVQLQAAKMMLAPLLIAAFTSEDAEASAQLRADLGAQGRSIGSFDTLIAGQALNRGWTVVSGNVREFERVEGLRVIDWTADG